MSNDSYVDRLVLALEEKSYSFTEIKKCCDYANHLISAGLPVLFDEGHVRLVLQLEKIDLNSYHVFSVSQINKMRTITAPSLQLKKRQHWILSKILSNVPVSPYAHGFEVGRSIKTNALLHANSDFVLCLDIKDFFPSISKEQVITAFTSLGYTRSASQMLSSVCCFNDSLPQGAPTSPKLSNIIFNRIDAQLATLAKEEGAIYSRYADDITFSSSHDLSNIYNKVKILFQNTTFDINYTKVRFYGPAVPKIITGLVVQKGTVRVPKHFKRSLRQEIYYCKRFGVLTHLENIGATRFVNYREYLYGKAYYVQMIEPQEGSIFLQNLDEIIWPSCFYN